MFINSTGINLFGFNLVWLGLVSWGNHFIPFGFLFLISHIFFIAQSSREVQLILVVTVFGILVDSALVYYNVFIFDDGRHIPFWLMVLWPCFATTISHSLRFLSHSKPLQLFVGAVCAPLSYIAGHKLQAVDFGQSIASTYLLLSVIWAGLFVLFFYIKDKLSKAEVSYV
ncbi:DUF2878 domain-containing protein [Colwellia psychrerythraea]|uniref:DUF2878 domain-containing protein n=1 Tax=Colwellia psychrerythraea TaxID=28229 RepID=A0A099KMN8_COLPS|nr:DUF2878 domain-containing protein [Colwellia psychrerythraea]KGJ91495.1 Protein of unknown function DUF2878 [Colwellia psychrerythraea]